MTTTLLRPGLTIHQRYRVEQLVGRGGMGAVYAAEDTRLGVRVALKQLLPATQAPRDALRDGFEREARVLAALRHPGIPKVTDYFSEGGELFLVMEFIAGPTLAELLDQRGPTFPPEQVLDWAADMLDLLDYLHSQRPALVHGDIKPHNLKLGPDGDLVLLDFGLARVLQGGTAAPALGYSPAYASLEQIQIRPTDARSDLYALAATLYHFLTGTPPPSALDRHAAVLAGDDDPLVPLARLPSPLARSARAALDQALALDPDDRPADARALLQALGRTPTPAGAAPVTVSGRAQPATGPTIVVNRPRPRRGVWRTAAFAGALIALISGLTLLLRGALWPPAPGASASDPLPSPAVGSAASPAPPTATARPTRQPSPTPAATATFGPTLTPVTLPVSAITPANAASVAQIARWGRGTINQLAVSGDGSIAALATGIGVRLYAVGPQALTARGEVPTDARVWSVSLSPDGALLAFGTGTGEVQLYQTGDLALLKNLDTGRGTVRSVVFAPDGQLVAAGFSDGAVRIWQVPSGDVLATLRGNQDGIEHVVFTPDGAALLSAGDDGTIILWRIADGAPLGEFRGPPGRIYALAVAPDGTRVASSTSNDYGVVTIWRLPDAPGAWHDTPDRTLRLQGRALALAFSPDGETLATGDREWRVQLWNVKAGTTLRTLERTPGEVASVVFAPNGAALYLATAQRVLAWPLDGPAAAAPIDVMPTDEAEPNIAMDSVLALAVSPDGANIAVGSDNHRVAVRAISDGRVLAEHTEHNGWVDVVAYAPDGSLVASGAWDGTIRLWRPGTSAPERVLPMQTIVSGVGFTPDGLTLVAAALNGNVRLFDLAGDRLLWSIQAHTNDLNALAISPDGQLFATGSDDGTVRVWRIASGELVRELRGPDYVRNVAFAPDGAVVAAAYEDERVRLWSVRDGSLVHELRGHDDSVQALAFSPDGQIVASGAFDATIRLWRASDGQPLAVLVGHTGPVSSLVFTPDGQTLFSGAIEGTVRLWGARSP